MRTNCNCGGVCYCGTSQIRPDHYVDASDFTQAARVQKQQLAADIASAAVQSNYTPNFTYAIPPQHPIPCSGQFLPVWTSTEASKDGEVWALKCNTCQKKVNVSHLTDKQLSLMQVLLEAIGPFAPLTVGYVLNAG